MTSREIYAKTFDDDEQQSNQNTCPECAGRAITNAFETVCDDCGLVLDDEQIDHGPEWREFEDDRTSKRRTGLSNSPARHDRGICAEIGWDQDSNGRQLKPRKRQQISRLRRGHKRAKTQTTVEWNRVGGFIDIRRMTGALGLSKSVRDQACKLFRSAQSEDLLTGRSIEGIASACIYAVCRLNEQPRTFGEIARVSKVPEDRVKHCYTILNRNLDLPVLPAGPKQYLPQIASRVDAHHETERRARELLERADEHLIANGRNPMGAAAGALYLAARQTGGYFTQDEIASVSDVSKVTLRERYTDLQAVASI